jgi:hypothetical protein
MYCIVSYYVLYCILLCIVLYLIMYCIVSYYVLCLYLICYTNVSTKVTRNNIVLLRDVFHIGLVIGPRPAVLA